MQLNLAASDALSFAMRPEPSSSRLSRVKSNVTLPSANHVIGAKIGNVHRGSNGIQTSDSSSSMALLNSVVKDRRHAATKKPSPPGGSSPRSEACNGGEVQAGRRKGASRRRKTFETAESFPVKGDFPRLQVGSNKGSCSSFFPSLS